MPARAKLPYPSGAARPWAEARCRVRGPEWCREAEAPARAEGEWRAWQLAAHARRSKWFRRPVGGTLHRAAFRIRGNIRRPKPLDDLRSSLWIPSLTRRRLAA